MRDDGLTKSQGPEVQFIVRADLLRWLYLARLALVTAILVAALFRWQQALAVQTFIATVMFVSALVVTGAAFWYTHVMRRSPGSNFLYGQVVFDVLVVTGTVHITLGPQSDFAWLFILVITEGALLLPFPGGVLIGALASILYFADIVWGSGVTPSGQVMLQIGLFALVAIATGIVGDRLREAGMILGTVQSELRRLRLDTRDILATISTGVATVDEEGTLIYLNPAGESLLGIDASRWTGQNAVDEIARASPGLAEIFLASFDARRTLFRRRAIANRDGEEITLGVSTTLRDQPDEVRAVTAIFQDITDFERLEVLNRRNERLEAVAELSAAMAHEIKNPLASIRSAVEQFSAPTLRPDDRDTLTRMVVRETDRLSRLLTDFIDFARLRIGGLVPVRAEDLVRDCLAVVQRHPDATERRIELVLDPIDPELRLLADPDLLHRALLNLLLNAIQFSPEEGRVELSVGRLIHDEEGLGVAAPIRIRVRDSGPGIREGDADRIFDPFYTTRRGGSGLGLSVVHRAVEAHGGAIMVTSAPSGGAEFSVYLPAMRGDDSGTIAGGEPGDE